MNTDIPDWFPSPHPLCLNVLEYVYRGDIQKSEKTVYSWFPPYTILLTGDMNTMATRRLIVAMLRGQFFTRISLARTDTSVCPLSKNQFRDITAGTSFKKMRPRDITSEWDVDYFWQWGLPSIFGQKVTMEQQALTRKDIEDQSSDTLDLAVELDLFLCGHEPQLFDWIFEERLTIHLSIWLAERRFMEQLALLDPELNAPVHSQDVNHPHPRTAPINFYTRDFPPSVSKKVELVIRIVHLDGEDNPRGWEREDISGRKRWVIALAQYLGPLWANDTVLRDEELSTRCRREEAEEDKIAALTNVKDLKVRELVLLQYWMRALQIHHGQRPVPFFSSVGIRVPWICPRCRGRDDGDLSSLSSLSSVSTDDESERE